MTADKKESTRVLSVFERHAVSIMEKEERSKIDWFYMEVFEGWQETTMFREQLTTKQYNPDDILHVLFDYTFFSRVIEREYDWRIGDDKELKDKCMFYLARAESVKKEMKDFAGHKGISKRIGHKDDTDAVNVYRQLLADAGDKEKAEKLLANMIKTDTKRAFEASESTMSLYSALAEIRCNIEEQLLTRLISPKVKSRTVFLMAEDFELPKPPEPSPLEPAPAEIPEEPVEQPKSANEARPDQASVINLEDLQLDDVSDYDGM